MGDRGGLWPIPGTSPKLLGSLGRSSALLRLLLGVLGMLLGALGALLAARGALERTKVIRNRFLVNLRICEAPWIVGELSVSQFSRLFPLQTASVQGTFLVVFTGTLRFGWDRPHL